MLYFELKDENFYDFSFYNKNLDLFFIYLLLFLFDVCLIINSFSCNYLIFILSILSAILFIIIFCIQIHVIFTIFLKIIMGYNSMDLFVLKNFIFLILMSLILHVIIHYQILSLFEVLFFIFIFIWICYFHFQLLLNFLYLKFIET